MAKNTAPKVLGKVKFLFAKMYLYDDDSLVGVNLFNAIVAKVIKKGYDCYFWVREKLNDKYIAEFNVIVIDWYEEEKVAKTKSKAKPKAKSSTKKK